MTLYALCSAANEAGRLKNDSAGYLCVALPPEKPRKTESVWLMDESRVREVAAKIGVNLWARKPYGDNYWYGSWVGEDDVVSESPMPHIKPITAIRTALRDAASELGKLDGDYIILPE